MNDSVVTDGIQPIAWRDGRVMMLDQRELPGRETWLRLATGGEVADGIRSMAVRGAPAIGIAAAYGVVLAADAAYRRHGDGWRVGIAAELDGLASARPTAVNLAWALRRMGSLFSAIEGNPVPALLDEARRIHREDIAANRRMGELGAALIESPCAILTHCNAGALATGGVGTALGVVRHGYAAGRVTAVFADETRPWLQGSRLTAWELHRDGIPVTLLADNAAASLLRSGRVGWVIVGSDRIAANGDVANKIGTYQLAIAARYHGVRLMVVAPTSTIDMEAPNGSAIPIEARAGEEVLYLGDQRLAPEGVMAWNPVFDVTPAELVDAIVTERGVVRSPSRAGMADLMGSGKQMHGSL